MGKFLIIAVSSLLLASCQTTNGASRDAVVETHEAMVSWINPPALVIWDIAEAAKSEAEGLDRSAMDGVGWQKLEGAALALEAGSRRMATARTLRVGNHTAVEAGFATQPEIQARIDQQPEWFRRSSADMAEQAGELARAAAAKDVQRTRDLVQGLSDSCQSCHTRYWTTSSS